MSWTELIIRLLQAQGQTLSRLAAFFGEDNLVAILEAAGESQIPNPTLFTKIKESASTDSPFWKPGSPFLEIETAVHELQLSAVLEFHLWSYPYYRYLIESSIELKAQVPELETFVEQALEAARTWVAHLPIEAEMITHFQRTAQVPWLRFRTECLSQLGKRPIEAV
ncbi:MAG: hypothetical protein ACO3A2_01790 [Bdellovibrionia bacterium]